MGKGRHMTHREKIHISLIVLPICMLVLFGCVSGWIYVNEMESQVYKSMEMAGLQVSADCDAFIKQISQVYGELVKQEDIRKILKEEMPSMRQYSDLKNLMGQLWGPEYLNAYINGFSYVNLEHEWVLSNKGLYTFDHLENVEKIKILLEEEVDGQNWKRNFWYNGTGQKVPDNHYQITLSGMSYVILQPMIGMSIEGVLLVNVKMDDFFQRQGLMGYELLVLDSQGNEVYCSSEAVPEQPGRKFLQYDTVSEATGWVYILYSEPVNSLHILGGLMVLFSLVMVCLMLILLCANRAREKIYRPVSQLVDQTRRFSQDEGEVTDEFLYLQHNISVLFHNKEEMEQQLKQYASQLSEYFMRRLLAGELAEDVQEQMGQIGIPVCKWYCVIVVSMEGQEQGGLESKMLLLAHDIPGDIIQALLLEPYWNGRNIVLLAGGDTQESLARNIDDFLQGLEAYVEMALECVVHVAVSREYDDVLRTNYAYYECQEALKSSILLEEEHENPGKVRPVYFEDVSRQMEMRVIYNTNLEKKLEEAIGEGDLEKSLLLIEEFVSWLEKSKVRSYELSMMLYHLLTDILTAVNNAGISVNEVFQNARQNIYRGLYMRYRPLEIRDFFQREVIEPVIAYINASRVSSADLVWNKIVALVEEKQGNVTLNECADYLGYHPGYIWRIMKSRGNVTFAEYLSAYKLRLAKQMLEETDISVANIAEQLSYSSAQNFIRFFSKNEGVTPGKYRNAHGKGAGRRKE